jgi:demethylmenaquinone methyltransferase/2-methoxy-6-polyprenyl-1,4-benzoquinol methylase
MFTRIARRYDLMNSLMTGGRHHAWRRRVALGAAGAPAGPVLDLATGTADLALAVRARMPGRFVAGADFSEDAAWAGQPGSGARPAWSFVADALSHFMTAPSPA